MVLFDVANVIYSTLEGGLAALAHSGDSSGLFTSLVQSMENAILHTHELTRWEVEGSGPGRDGHRAGGLSKVGICTYNIPATSSTTS
jgi:hypothetical protein